MNQITCCSGFTTTCNTLKINFRISNRLSPTSSFLLNDTPVHPKQNTKFLGLILDDKLNFQQHIEHVINKVSSGIFALRTLAKFSNIDVLLSAYYGLIVPRLLYALPIWGCENSRTLLLFRLQKRAVRTIFSMSSFQSCKPIFQSCNILTLPSLYIYESLSFLKQNFQQFNTFQNHRYNLRLSYDIPVPAHHTTFFKKHLYYNAISLFNKLPNYIKAESSHCKFRKKN